MQLLPLEKRCAVMPSILLIEDDNRYREALTIALVACGYTVTQAKEGAQGVKLFRAKPTDFVITEIVMPNKEGTAVVAELRREYPDVGIIAVSGGRAQDAPLYLKIAEGFGADRTLKKPFTFATLFQAIEESQNIRRRHCHPSNFEEPNHPG
jgi:DNA-binding response OmpR family regulator